MKSQNGNMIRITSICLTILFLMTISAHVTHAVDNSVNFVSTNYKYQAWGQYQFIKLYDLKYVPLLPNQNNKVARLVVDNSDIYSLETGDMLDLGLGYSLTAKQVDVYGKRVWLEFDKDGQYVDDQIVGTDTGDATWTCALDKVLGENDVHVLKVHVNQVNQGEDNSVVEIDGLWLIDYANATNVENVQQSSTTPTSTPTPQAPVASFISSVTSGTVPLNVVFSDTSTGTPTSWFWDFGDEATSTEQNRHFIDRCSTN